jgi:ribosomal protein S18 acetylase RimI-like enzyme
MDFEENLAQRFINQGDPTGWFEVLYAQAQGDERAIPWESGQPHPTFLEWIAENGFKADRPGRKALVVACGLGHDAEALARLGFTQLYPLFSSLSLKRTWVLYDLFVAPEARRQGVAEALLERAKKLGQESGAAEISLDTAIDNLSAQALYEKFGFVRDEEFYTYYLTIP